MAKAFINPGREKRTLYGHPWIYRSDIARVEGTHRPGDVVEVVSSRGRFLGRAMYNPASQIALRFFTFRDEPVDEAFFFSRVERALAYRKAFADLSSCRLIFSESDGLPSFVADAFGDCIVIQSVALGMEPWKPVIVDALKELLHPQGIWERSDIKVRELEGLEQRQGPVCGNVPDQIKFMENGIALSVDVKNGQKTGYFLDQKENRAAIAPFVKERSVLDCFTHTGGFALHGAKYGASSVKAVDISKDALTLAAGNALRNGFAIEMVEANCFDFLREEIKANSRYQTVVLDPPAFTKTRAAVPAALRGYKEINLRGMKLVEDGGYLVTCSCSSHVLPSAFAEMLVGAAADARVVIRQVEARTQGRDHPILLAAPETQYLKCHILQVFHT